jgi:hypothetical protein
VRFIHVIKACVAVSAAALVLSVGAALASPAPAQKEVWVSPTPSISGKDKNCATASYTSVQAAVDGVQSGGTV